MVKCLLLTIWLALSLVFPHWTPRGQQHLTLPWQTHREQGVNGWKLNVRLDRFTYRRTCSLHRDRVHYERQALVFHLPPHTDTSRAAYRIDNGAPRWVSADAMELARLGFALHDDDLNNPSGGVVRITLARLAGGKQVEIEPRSFGPWIRFNAGGIEGALAAALKKCGEDEFDRPTDLD
jgi:hypothetical protein